MSEVLDGKMSSQTWYIFEFNHLLVLHFQRKISIKIQYRLYDERFKAILQAGKQGIQQQANEEEEYNMYDKTEIQY